MRPQLLGALIARRWAKPMYEMSHIIETSDIDAVGFAFEFSADVSQRQALAIRLGLLDLRTLTVAGHVRRDGDSGTILVKGQFLAEVEQRCVVTLEPVEAVLDDSFQISFLSPAEWDIYRARNVDMVPDDDDVEPLEGTNVDLGATVVEYLALAIDPYPRCRNAVFSFDQGAQVDPGPFAALAKLRNKV
jgi:uncharacterized metal-binding protein YceD (DUF177 family)